MNYDGLEKASGVVQGIYWKPPYSYNFCAEQSKFDENISFVLKFTSARCEIFVYDFIKNQKNLLLSEKHNF